MLPMPAMRRWSRMIDFTGAFRPLTASATMSAVKPSLSGSGPRPVVTSSKSSVSQRPPNLRISVKRSSVPSSRCSTARRKGSGGASARRCSSAPVMRKWMTSMSLVSRRKTRYLPRRSTISMRAPTTPSRNVATSMPLITGTGLPVSGGMVTAVMRRPSTRDARSRRMVSTSGSSGILTPRCLGRESHENPGCASTTITMSNVISCNQSIDAHGSSRR